MRVAVIGATGNVGTALLGRLAHDPQVAGVVGVARRPPSWTPPKTTWRALDVTADDLVDTLREVDSVVHLAWQIQPGRDERELWHVNVVGSQRVFQAAADAGVDTLVYASSIGAYSPGPDSGERVREDHPTHGIASSTYSRQKAYVERMLDAFEPAHPRIRVVRLRPGLIFQRDAASEVRRFFLGTLFPNRLATSAPMLPRVDGLRFQAVHAEDAAEAYLQALHRPVHGAFNVAAEPVLTLEAIAERIGARTFPVPAVVLRPLASATWRMRLHPVEPGWVDLALDSPLMDTSRTRHELGWSPGRSATEAVTELLEGIAAGAGRRTPTLQPDRRRSRWPETATRQGARYSTDPATQATGTRPPGEEGGS